MALFADTILKIIQDKLSVLYGLDWQQQLVKDGLLDEDKNLRDVHALLWELSRNGKSSLRLPLNDRINKRDELKLFYDELENLLGERNAWVHRQVEENKEELIELANLVRLLSAMLDVHTKDECDKLISLLTVKAVEGGTTKESMTLPSVKEVSNLQSLVLEKVWKLGDPITSQFTSHSYSLDDQFEVIDRISNTKLSKLNPVTHAKLLPNLRKLRPGSRLRLTHDGIVSAFFTEKWGYLEKVNRDEWFPNHLANDL